jgi:CubicO group peptidase (beta-lactamase class C family)
MRLRPLFLTTLTLLATSHSGFSQSSKPPALPQSLDVEAIDSYVSGMVQEKGLTGLALTIVKDGKVVLSEGYGKRSLEDGAPVEPETVFAVGSVTKQFACACVLLLAEEGKLSIDDKVAKYFPDLTLAGDVTLYQLMNHTSGYPDFYPLDFVDRRMGRPIAVDSLIKEYAGGKLDFKPGTRWSYSNTGYMILGRVVEKVAGMPFGEFLSRRILAPVGMEHAVFEPRRPDGNRARGYIPFALGPPEPATPEAEGWLFAAGGLWASAPDIARWDIALMEGKVLKPETLKLMTSPIPLADGRSKDYGCGLNIRRDDGETVLSHGGAISGFRATNIFIPRTRSAVVVLINDEQSDPGLGPAIAGLLVRREAQSDIPKVVGPTAKEAALGFFHQMQAGELDRSKLGEEFSIYLTDAKVKAAALRLKELGEPEKVEILGVNERGGMEVALIRLTFKSVVLKGLLYRSPDGKIQQLLFDKA